MIGHILEADLGVGQRKDLVVVPGGDLDVDPEGGLVVILGEDLVVVLGEDPVVVLGEDLEVVLREDPVVLLETDPVVVQGYTQEGDLGDILEIGLGGIPGVDSLEDRLKSSKRCIAIHNCKVWL